MLHFKCTLIPDISPHNFFISNMSKDKSRLHFSLMCSRSHVDSLSVFMTIAYCLQGIGTFGVKAE